MGLHDVSLSERMQLDKDLTLTKAVIMARQSKENNDLRGEMSAVKRAC